MAEGRLQALIAAEIDQAVAAPVTAIAAAARQRHGAVSAVLFYGSCLRHANLEDRIVDLYLLVDSYATAQRGRLSALANRALPPNVYYLETQDAEGRPVRAKYAVCSLADFATGAAGGWFHPYLWARFAQPTRLLYCRDAAVKAQVTAALAGAAAHTAREGAALMVGEFTSRELWKTLFRETYRTELRAEGPERVDDLYEANRGYFEAVTDAALAPLRVPTAAAGDGALPTPAKYRQGSTMRRGRLRARWRLRRAQGKLLSVLRLIKAAFTFAGGPDYLAWKIERHSGVALVLTPWQRRHPVLAAPLLFWRLYRRGAFR